MVSFGPKVVVGEATRLSTPIAFPSVTSETAKASGAAGAGAAAAVSVLPLSAGGGASFLHPSPTGRLPENQQIEPAA